MGLVEILLFLLASTSMGSIRTESRSTNTTFRLPFSCRKSCGSISFGYPFGIDDGCFRTGFNLTCRNHSTSSPRLFLGDGTIEVTRIDTNQGLVYIKPPTIVMGIDAEFKRASLIDLENWPYSFELMEHMTRDSYQGTTSNRVYVVGCSATASLVDRTTNKTISTCFSICAAGDPSQYSEWSDVNSGCCTLDLNFKNTTALEIQLTRLNQKELHLVNTSGIKVIMFDGDDDVLQGVLKGRRTNAEATLAWYMNDHLSCEEAKNTDTYACVSQNSLCQGVFLDSSYINNSVGYLCRCSTGYQGNPYVPSGCQATSFTRSPANDCATKCGSVNILFPFGLKQGCYRGKSFALTCNETSGPPVLLFNSHYKVSTILLEEGKLELERVNEYDYTFESERTRLFACFEEQTIVSWVIASQFCEDARKNMTTFACVDAHSSCFDTTTTNNIQDVSGYYCKCSQGYQGNPYLRHGCKDINECNSTEKPLCYGICTNTDGGYTCTCAAGTYGDPKLAPCIPNNKKQTLLLGVIIGASNGIGLLLLCSSLLILRRKWKKRKQKKTREKYFHQNHGLLLQQLISSTEDISEKTKIFSLEEMEKATNNFDETRVLGRGGHGTVYKGILSDQRVVAVKKSKYMKQSEIDQFINEVAVLSQINHRNIVKLFGCCLETEVPLLIYEFISNGTLLDHLHIPNGNSILSWDDRLRIAVEAAGALAYLHSAASISIFHRDVKSSNVLLDDHLTVKISDFGSSRLIPLDQTHLLTGVQGTFGYLDPEYYHTSQLTEKSDVYSFGVILLELLTGKKPIFSTECEDRLNLSMHFLQTVRENHRFDLIDDLVMKEATEEELIDMIGLVEMCLRLKGAKRPTMKEVEYKVQNLRRIRLKKTGHCLVKVDEETEHPPRDSPYAFSEVVDQANQYTSRNYTLEKEFMWSHHCPR
uniref:Protein kinase domain-containing protein n=1 Tax=Musa acuminata subsp. malaccensis TaxID=214687 RepID=A0A804IXS0_MUSAM